MTGKLPSRKLSLEILAPTYYPLEDYPPRRLPRGWLPMAKRANCTGSNFIGGGNFPGANFPQDNAPETNFLSGHLPRGNFPSTHNCPRLPRKIAPEWCPHPPQQIPPWKVTTRKIAPRYIAPPEGFPRDDSSEIIVLQKIFPWKIAPGTFHMKDYYLKNYSAEGCPGMTVS